MNHEALFSKAADDGVSPYLQPQPGVLPLVTESGLPDPVTFPVEDLGRLFTAVLREERHDLHYGTFVDGELHYGYLGLREALANRARIAGPHTVDPSWVMLTSGGVQGISLAAAAFLDDRDVAAIECPTWDFVVRDIALAGSEVVTVPIDENGLDTDRLESTLQRLRAAGKRLKLLYTIPTFNVPTGAVMSIERRRRLVQLAAEYEFVIIEDDVYGELRYAGETLPSLFELDDAGLVIRVNSFSKTIMPALRLGWVTAHPDLLAALARVRRDLGTSHLTARVLTRFLDEGLYDDQLERVRDFYRDKRDHAIAELRAHGGSLIEVTPPAGGYFLWLKLAPNVDTEAVHAHASENGVICRPGHRFFSDSGDGDRYLRLSFTEPSKAAMTEVAAVLGEAVTGDDGRGAARLSSARPVDMDG